MSLHFFCDNCDTETNSEDYDLCPDCVLKVQPKHDKPILDAVKELTAQGLREQSGGVLPCGHIGSSTYHRGRIDRAFFPRNLTFGKDHQDQTIAMRRRRARLLWLILEMPLNYWADEAK